MLAPGRLFHIGDQPSQLLRVSVVVVKASTPLDTLPGLSKPGSPPSLAVVTAAALKDALPSAGYVTAEWVKRHYAISNSTLYKWISEGRFPAPVRIGPRAVRWSSLALRVFEASLASAELRR